MAQSRRAQSENELAELRDAEPDVWSRIHSTNTDYTKYQLQFSRPGTKLGTGFNQAPKPAATEKNKKPAETIKENEEELDSDTDPWENEVRSVVIDSGSGLIKAGFSGEDEPRVVFPTIVATKETQTPWGALLSRESYVGYEALTKSEIFNLSYPVDRGNITDWDAMEKLWRHVCYKELKVKPRDHPILLTEPLFHLKSYRENMTEIMFENFKVPAFYLKPQVMLSLYAAGKRTGIVVDVGHGMTQITPIYIDEAYPGTMSKMNQAGLDITNYLISLLNMRGYNFGKHNPATFRAMQHLKEKLCHITQDYDGDINTDAALKTIRPMDELHRLSDGQSIMVGSEKFRAPEWMFQPKNLGFEGNGIPHHIMRSIKNWDPSIKRMLLQNVVVAGGSTMLPGFTMRLQTELQRLAPPTMQVRLLAPSERRYAAWNGGSMLSALTTFSTKMCVSKQEYEETGVAIVHRKCPYY